MIMLRSSGSIMVKTSVLESAPKGWGYMPKKTEEERREAQKYCDASQSQREVNRKSKKGREETLL